MKTNAQLFEEFIEGLEPPDRSELEEISDEFIALIKERRSIKGIATREEE